MTLISPCWRVPIVTKYSALNGYLINKYPHFEQGGFIKSAKLKNSIGRLEMAGGEFCINACRSFIAVIAEDYYQDQQLTNILAYREILNEDSTLKFNFECSGVNDLLQGEARIVDLGKSEFQTSVTIKMPIESISINDWDGYVFGCYFELQIVSLPGIVHIVIESKFIVDLDERQILFEIISRLALEDSMAVGLIIVDESSIGISIKPLVFVKALNSIFNETSCGSGSLACVVSKLMKSNLRKLVLEILQPSLYSLNIESRIGAGYDNKLNLTSTVKGFAKIKNIYNDVFDWDSSADLMVANVFYS